jgi:acyl-coenzyme A thioesterase PaaI-like protein
MAMEMLQAAPDLGTALKGFAAIGHNAALGLVALGHGEGWIEYRMEWRPELTGDPDGELIAPAAIYSLLDTSCSLTPWAKLGYFSPSPTLDLRVDFLRPPAPRTSLIARGECHLTTPHLAFMRGVAHEGDPADPVAQCTGTFMFVDLKP